MMKEEGRLMAVEDWVYIGRDLNKLSAKRH